MVGQQPLFDRVFLRRDFPSGRVRGKFPATEVGRTEASSSQAYRVTGVLGFSTRRGWYSLFWINFGNFSSISVT